MANYQTQTDLTWLYDNASGLLSITAKISIQLNVNEKVNVSVTPISKNSCTITLTVVAGVNNSPVTQIVPYTNIGAHLDTVPAVRSMIDTLPPVSVKVPVYKNNVLQGEVTNVSSSSAEIVIE